MMSPSGSRLVSASKVLPLENIIEEGEEMLEEEEEVVVDRGELIKSCRVRTAGLAINASLVVWAHALCMELCMYMIIEAISGVVRRP